MIIITSPQERFYGELFVPGDRLITSLAIMLGALARGVTEVRGFSEADGCRSAVNCLRALGVKITSKGNRLLIEGRNRKLDAPARELDAGPSNTTALLLLGILAGQDFKVTLTGGRSLQGQFLQGVAEPLQQMGVQFEGQTGGLPVTFRGGRLKPISCQFSRAEAPVKSAVLLAGLYPAGATVFEELRASPDHAELMLARFGAKVTSFDGRVSVQGAGILKSCLIRVPGDISAAAFLIAAAAMLPGSEVLIKRVGVNPARCGIIDALMHMGADIQLRDKALWGKEPVADILIKGGPVLKAVQFGPEMFPRLAGDLPALMVAALVAEGKTVISIPDEQQTGEPDPIISLIDQLKKLGAAVELTEQGITVEGKAALKGVDVDSCGDHRAAMALAVAGLVAEGETAVYGAEVMNGSFPGFMPALRSLIMK